MLEIDGLLLTLHRIAKKLPALSAGLPGAMLGWLRMWQHIALPVGVSTSIYSSAKDQSHDDGQEDDTYRCVADPASNCSEPSEKGGIRSKLSTLALRATLASRAFGSRWLQRHWDMLSRIRPTSSRPIAKGQ